MYPDLGPSQPSRVSCYDYDPAHGEVFRANTCILHGDPTHFWCGDGGDGCGVILFRGACPDGGRKFMNSTTFPRTGNNIYYVPNATTAVYFNPSCNGTVTVRALQRAGHETGSKVLDTAAMLAAAIIAAGEALLAE